ncbi:hypothetical protein Syun_014341 [Stephania yunnanensis]|uniref:Uncharacterized protein n=1 Tax=Stephania yunnanensis TaxID=152371 RepID=A0AAP0PBT5_9MAGN
MTCIYDLRMFKFLIQTAICNELTQSQPNTSIDETELHLSVMEHDDKGWTYRLG